MRQALRNFMALVMVGVLCSGCAFLWGAGAAATVVAGAYEYVAGELKRPYGSSMGASWVACHEALKDEGIDVIDAAKEEPTHWWLKGKTKRGRDIKISLETVSRDVTKIGIRVGLRGDKILSEKIHDAITRQLGG
jgi:hypothetical protein